MQADTLKRARSNNDSEAKDESDDELVIDMAPIKAARLDKRAKGIPVKRTRVKKVEPTADSISDIQHANEDIVDAAVFLRGQLSLLPEWPAFKRSKGQKPTPMGALAHARFAKDFITRWQDKKTWTAQVSSFYR